MYTIYKVTNEINGKVYIGQTKMSLKRRFAAHKNNQQSSLYKEIQKYGFQNFTICPIDHAETKEEAVQKEIFWTSQYDSANQEIGYNKAVGYSLTGERNPFFGKHHSAETLEKVSGENHWTTRKKFSDETRSKMSASQYGAKSNNHKACICVETGETFPYVRSASRKYGFSECHIHDVCKGKRKRCGGYHWKYIKDEEVIHNKE